MTWTMDIFNFQLDRHKFEGLLVLRFKSICNKNIHKNKTMVSGNESVLLVPNNASGPAVTYFGKRKLRHFEFADLR